ncbi:Kinesin-like protein KIF12 [Acropora cervicornis]|uniref:Kinesin-like protein n=1 Tax=Acropora cervicornis TaxID=6130 RepID=A0AAD9R6I0_ACRCE|nr:Kinesin-like protein KIF12 [Acropora cervicornis]
MEEASSSKPLRMREELFEDEERTPSYDSDSPSDTPSVHGDASASTSARSSRSSNLGSGLSSRSASTSESDIETESSDNVRVVARVRPLNLSEKERGDKNIIKLPFDSSGAVWIDNSFGQIKPFTFNAAFGEETSQQEMFEQCGIKNLVEMAVAGYSCTAFAYGQTGSGKTYTITGPMENSTDKERFIPDPDMQGLIERFVAAFFNNMRVEEWCFHFLFELKENSLDVEFTIKASYLEVQDLLNPSSARDSLPVRWSRSRGFYVENLFFVECDTVDDLTAVLEEGLSNRQVGSHMMNDHSSRSHSMLTVYIDTESSDPGDVSGYPIVKHGKLSLVDLAGSERVKETKSVGGAFTESQNINKSLLTLGVYKKEMRHDKFDLVEQYYASSLNSSGALVDSLLDCLPSVEILKGNCISALSDPRKKSGHISYRDSKLTKLLADSLGGDGITLMVGARMRMSVAWTVGIACISPSSYVVQDTLNTLRYAHRAKKIKNKPVVQMDPKETLILSLKREIKLLRTENAYFRQQLGLASSDSQTSLTSTDSETTIGTEHGSTPKGNITSPETADRFQVPEDTQRLTTARTLNEQSQQNRAFRSQLILPPTCYLESLLLLRSMAVGANSGLYDMLQEYMVENEHLRTTNVELFQSREEVLSRENDRLSKKLEELERVIVSSPMSLRTYSGVESLRGVERTSSLPDEYSFQGHSAGDARPSPLTQEEGHLERRNSHPLQSRHRRRASDPLRPSVATKFPPISNGPYPNFIGQSGWSEIPEDSSLSREAVPKPNNNFSKEHQDSSVPGPSQKSKPSVGAKKRSIPVTLSERQKPPNSYARIFAAQKQKKAKENETKIVKNGDSKQRVEPEEHVNGHKHHSDHFGPWRPVDSGIPASYDSTLELAERTRKELQELDSQIEHHKFMAQNRYNNNPPR